MGGVSTVTDVESAATDWVGLCRSSKPLIAVRNGAAIGVGITMVLPFDRILASRNAKVSVRFVKLGIVPELASTHFLVAWCGFGAASWLTLSGDTILGDEAERLRLVDRACDPDQVVAEAMADAAVLAESSSLAVRLIKDLLTQNAVETDLDAAQSREFAALLRRPLPLPSTAPPCTPS